MQNWTFSKIQKHNRKVQGVKPKDIAARLGYLIDQEIEKKVSAGDFVDTIKVSVDEKEGENFKHISKNDVQKFLQERFECRPIIVRKTKHTGKTTSRGFRAEVNFLMAGDLVDHA
jgi:predicted ATP-grasp superfamily ATP-dependent carboligase